jgi:signal transduction histidine kinase
MSVQLMFWCGIAIAVLLAVLGAGLYLTLSHALESQFNSSLTSRATLLVNTLDWDPHRGFHVSTDFTPVTGGTSHGMPRYFQIWTPNGRSVLRARALGRRNLKFIKPPLNSGRFHAVDLSGGRDGRELIIRFREGDSDDSRQQHGQQAGPGTVDHHMAQRHHDNATRNTRRSHAPRNYILAVARPTGDVNDALSSIGWALAVSCSLATLLSAALIAGLLHRGMRPVTAIAEQIANVGTAGLNERISTVNIPRELYPIVDRLNKLLERVEAAVIREKALTADMAHELRTPLAGLRTATELALTRDRVPEEYQHTLRQSLDISVQMQDLVENLLTLARLEAGSTPAARASQCCRLDTLLNSQLDFFADRIKQRDVTLDKKDIAPVEVQAPPELMDMVLRNVLDNAASYVNAGGTIRIALREMPHDVMLEVANTGSSVSPQQVSQVFERFWRGDIARSDHGRHSGLGLAIVQNIMRLAGGSAKVESTIGGWFTLHLLFPKHGGDGLHDV